MPCRVRLTKKRERIFYCHQTPEVPVGAGLGAFIEVALLAVTFRRGVLEPFG